MNVCKHYDDGNWQVSFMLVMRLTYYLKKLKLMREVGGSVSVLYKNRNLLIIVKNIIFINR